MFLVSLTQRKAEKAFYTNSVLLTVLVRLRMEKREPFYKLTYFEGGRGRAEPSRMMFHLAGVEFTDERLSLEEWIQGKSAGKTKILTDVRNLIAFSY